MRAFLVCFLSLALCTACASSIEVSRDQYRHMISIDADGGAVPVYVTEEGTTLSDESMDEHIREIVQQIRDEQQTHVVLIIHGGLISTESAIEHTKETLPELENENFYPIFVNWDTGIGTSYADHLFRIRGGRAAPVKAVLTSPLHFVADFGRAITRLPVTAVEQGTDSVRDLFITDEPNCPPEGWEQSVRLDRTDDEIGVGERLETLVTGIVPGAARIGTTVVLDGIGSSAFGNMQRRARVLFLLDEDFETSERQQSGALSKLMRGLRRLKDRRRADTRSTAQAGDIVAAHAKIVALQADLAAHRAAGYGRGNEAVPTAEAYEAGKSRLIAELEEACAELIARKPFRVSIVAHSMGAIVANQLVRRNTDFLFQNIVYMGAACTIQEFADTTLAYVKEHPYTRFHNLCLHPVEESNDRYGYGFLPFGSLLDWIDHYVTDRRSALDGTLGKWENVTAALPVMDYLTSDVRRRIVVKGFGRSKKVPRSHGEFNDVKFRLWEPHRWEIDPTPSPDCETETQ